jgi:hypothetical protein
MKIMSYCYQEIRGTDESTLFNVMTLCVESNFLVFLLGNEKQCE